MATARPILLVISAASICGACVHNYDVAEAVGPAPVAAPAPAHGLLRVYTPTQEFLDEEVPYYTHRDYSILAPGGGVLKRVYNADDAWDETPALVALPVGSYKIRSWTQRSGVATIPVVIEPDRTTNVFLDGSGDRGAAPRSAYVALPDGEIVGWSARTTLHPVAAPPRPE